MTGSGDPPPDVRASARRFAWSGEGGTPSTLKPTIFLAGWEELLSMLLLPAMIIGLLILAAVSLAPPALTRRSDSGLA
jgi:hypothetical protein